MKYATFALILTVGCTSAQSTAQRDVLTSHVAKYDPPPPGLKRVKVGVPPFQVSREALLSVAQDQAMGQQDLSSLSPEDRGRYEEMRRMMGEAYLKMQELGMQPSARDSMSRDAADQLTTLADQTERFDVIERAQVEQLLKEQGLTGIVTPEDLAQPGRVKGVDYLFLGKITNLRVKAEKSGSSVDIGDVTEILGLGSGFDYKNEKSTVTVECGVDLRLVNPTTGTVLASQFSEYKKTDSISATGLHIMGVGGDAQAELQIDEDSRGKVLRLALDDAVRKMLPKVDQRLLEIQAK